MIGKKTFFGARTWITAPSRMQSGCRCLFESDVTLKIVGEKARLILGDHCYVARFTQFDIMGQCEIGNHVLFATGSFIVDHNHGMSRGLRIDEQECELNPVIIGDDVWLGAYSVVLPGVSIGNGAVIGAHATVTKSIPEFAIAAGVPAKVIGYRAD